jgi:YVTN family beta-propeller protein
MLRPIPLKTRLAVFCFVCITIAGVAFARQGKIALEPDGSYIIPTGQRITPAGSHVEVNDRPLGMALSPDGSTLAVVTGSNFNPRALHLVSTNTHAVQQSIKLGNSFVGVAFGLDGNTLYVGGGSDNDVKIFHRQSDAQFAQDSDIAIANSAPSGLALSPDGKLLYVALNQKNALAIIDTATRKVTQVPVGTYPYTAVVTPDNSRVYVSNWGGRIPKQGDTTDGMNPVVVDARTGIPSTGTVSVVDPVTATVKAEIEVGLHPSALALSPSGDRLYVANANSDTVSIINTGSNQLELTLKVGLTPNAPLGSSPNAIAVSEDGKRLYVADAASNAIAVVNPTLPAHAVAGFIPTGWYPTAVTLVGNQLAVASGYGFGSIAPLSPGETGRSYTDRMGIISFLKIPSSGELALQTKEVRENNRVLPASAPDRRSLPNPIPMSSGQPSPIKHVFYIIKENRTYDQVFGDLPQGNGDPSLVEFGRDVSPNHHALAEQFVLLDNFYGPGDQSALGHRWCTQGYASDWVFKYSNARNDQNPMLFAPTDFIWDNMKAHGKSVRSFGERGLNTITPADATWTDIYNDWKNGSHNVTITPQAVIVGLRDIYSPNGVAFEQRVPDQVRADGFLREFDDFVKHGNLPGLVVLLLPNDHTNGTSPGYPTPRAQVADNDLALGRIVEAISTSKYWKESAIFVTEDDSQDGVDHVDGHRTVGLVISPYTKRGIVDSTFYSIINMYRTMEQILGLSPQNQFDLAAEPMFSVFRQTPDFTPYHALHNQIPLDEMNPALSATKGLQRELAQACLRMDFSEPDAAPADVLNRAIWHSVKGYDVPYGGRARKPSTPALSSTR